MLLSTITYSQNFITGAKPPTTQCTHWQSFVTQLTVRTYPLLTIQGTNNMIGLTVNDSTVIGSIAQALRTSESYGPVTSNGASWVVGSCGGGAELSVDHVLVIQILVE